MMMEIIGSIMIVMRFILYTYINMYDGCSLITRRCHRANRSPIANRRCNFFLGFDGESG